MTHSPTAPRPYPAKPAIPATAPATAPATIAVTSAAAPVARRPFLRSAVGPLLAAALVTVTALAGAGLTPASAQDAAKAPPIPGKTDLKAVKAGTYQADPSHTLVGWRVSHFGFNDYFGIFGDSTGQLQFDPAKPTASKVEITIPLGKVTTASAELTEHLKTADFFEVARFPEARFVSRSISGDGPAYDIEGDLTIKGKTQPVTLKATFTGVGVNPMNKAETVGFQATTTIRRSAFGVNYVLPMVSDEVKLDISAAFEKK